MRVIIGLGNPGSEYEKTPHNVGFWTLELLAERRGITFSRSTCMSWVGEHQRNGEQVLLVQPQTYMNRSGEAAGQIRDSYRLSVPDFLLVHDDLDLPAGRIRIKRGGGGAGGNRGVASVIEVLGSQDFARVKIGVGRPPDHSSVVNFVLRCFTPREEASMLCAVRRAADAVDAVLTHGLEQAMDRFNRTEPEELTQPIVQE
jgi:PTH1 family peptidyl-tRNA hydrolase